MTGADLTISLELTSNVYRRSDDSEQWPRLLVKATLNSPEIACVELRGEFDSGTVLESSFRLEHFDFFDLTTSQSVDKTPFEGTCEPRDFLQPRHVIEIKKGLPIATSQLLEDMNPLADPVRMLKAGHEYRIRLKEQKVWWLGRSKADLFKERTKIPVDDLPDDDPLLKLASGDELRLRVED